MRHRLTFEEELPLSYLISHPVTMAPQARAKLAQQVVTLRHKLDAGMGDKPFDFYRAKEHEGHGSYVMLEDGKYRLILVGALIMRTGAKIRDADLQHLRELVPHIHSSPGYALPFCDEGFRDPGKAQFLAALDHYIPALLAITRSQGNPRHFRHKEGRLTYFICFTCGKVEADSDKALLRCARCLEAYYCDTVRLAFALHGSANG